MKFKMPTASRKRLEELLEYLGKTDNYSEYYKGNRAEDFKKCFDIESPWCKKYADIVLRGLEKRELGYSEGHHAVPKSFYGVKRNCRKIDDGNLFTLSYAEHVWAHYCACYCATGKMQGKMTKAFLTMYRIYVKGRKHLMPLEAELLDAIPKMEIKRIQAMEPQWAKVEAEGRTHHSEDPKQYWKEYRKFNKEKYNVYREANKARIAKNHKAYYEANKERITEYNKAWREANKEKLAKCWKAYRKANRDKLAERSKTYCKAWREVNRERIAENGKAYREANKEKILEKRKARYDAMTAAGYRFRKDPVTGKRHWVFVGLPATPETPKSTSGAA
jgi:hypothetical protein